MLANLSTEFVFHFMLLFARISSAFSLLPLFGSKYISSRIKLVFALSVTLIMLPTISIYLPKYNNSHITHSFVVSYLFIEIIVGLMISIAANFYLQSVHFIGQILSMQSGLGSAAFFDPMQQSQVALFSNFILLTILALILASDTHHLFFSAIADSYIKFPPGEMLSSADMSNFVVSCLNNSFILAFKLSSPFIVVSLAILTGSGLLSRLMPNLQVFFVITPAQILVMLFIAYVVLFVLITKLVTVIANSLNIIGL